MCAFVCMHMCVSSVWSALVPAQRRTALRDARKTAYANVQAGRTHADMGWGRAWQEGSTPLHLASKNGLESVVQLLIDKGADVNAVDKVGTSGLAWRERRLGLAGH